ncbi:hypothetical protein GP5015_956 [gamma proteobacterium HTCC5015]|nr:hypothetical protein GP5015_956 [gamma proteobacterium HTCC5015]
MNRFLVVVAAGLMLSACADQGMDNYNNSSLSGSATKGVMMNSDVVLYGFEDGQPFVLGRSNTDAQGDYELSITGTYRGPAKLVISGAQDGSSTMICDAPAGCGSTDFGESMSVSSAMKLTAYQREVLPGQPVTLHATPYTHLVAGLVEADGVSAASIAEATRQVSDLFQLPGDFAAMKPVNVADADAVAAADSAELRYSALTAAFAGGGESDMADRLESYRETLASLGGQLEESSSNPAAPTLAALYSSAKDVADQVNSNLLRAEFDSVLANLDEGETTDAGGDGSNADSYDELIAASLDDADRLSNMLSGEALDLYWNSQVNQLDWVLTDDLVPSIMVGVDVFKLVLVAALANDVAQDNADINGELDMTDLVAQSGMAATYNVNTQTLRYFTPAAPEGLGVDIQIDVTPVINGLLPARADGALTYTLKEGSYLHNPSFSVDFVKESHVRLEFAEQDDFSPAQIAFKMLMELGDPNQLQAELGGNDVISTCFQEANNDPNISSNDAPLYAIDCVASDFLQGLNASGELGFGVTVTKADETQQFDIDFLGYGDVNLTNPDAPTLVNLEIRDGHLYAPNGDAIYTIEQDKGLVLNLGNSDNAMYAHFGVESDLVPTTEVTLSTQFHDLQNYLDLLNGSSLDFDFERLQIGNLVDAPLTTLMDLFNAATQTGAITDFFDYLLADTTPQDYVHSMNMGLDVAADEEWPSRNYQVDFQTDIIELVNQDGVRFKFTAERGAILSRIAIDGNDILEIRVTQEGTEVIDIEDAVTIDTEAVPVDRIMSLFARLDILIDLDLEARALLAQYEFPLESGEPMAF